MERSWLAIALPLLLAVPHHSAEAQWDVDGNRLCPTSGDQDRGQLLSDGTGGAFVVWQDKRAGELDIYCSRFMRDGRRHSAWSPTGLPLCTAPNFQSSPRVVSDGEGGGIACWTDSRTGSAFDVYAQRFGPFGQLAASWPPDGALLCAGTGGSPTIASDDMNGAFVVWNDSRNTIFNQDIYAQRVSPQGSLAPGWPANGIGVNTSLRSDFGPMVMPDGAGGVFVVWSGPGAASDLFAQRITDVGDTAPGWPSDGLVVSAAANDQRDPVMVSDGAGGAIVAWYDARSDNGDIYAQRFTADGEFAIGWPVGGLAVCTALNDQLFPTIVGVSDGAIIAWRDGRKGSDYDIYAQRITTAGAIASGWPANGIPVCATSGHQSGTASVSDGAGGAIVVWSDERDDDGDIYAQRIRGDGLVPDGWPMSGVGLCTAAGVQNSAAIATDGQGGALVVWTDTRSVDESSIYVARVTSFGLTGPDIPPEEPPSRFELVGVRPNPTKNIVAILFRVPGPGRVTAKVWDVSGRLVRTMTSEVGVGTQALVWNGCDESGSRVKPGVYAIRVNSAFGGLTARSIVVQ